MNRRFPASTLVALALGALMTGCGSSDRPRDLALDDVKPCELVPTSTLGNVGITASPNPLQTIEGVNEEGTSCYYAPRSGADISIAAVTNQGIDRWTDGSMESFKATDQPRVQGFRAIKVEETGETAGPHDQCLLYVDVASGQSLKVDVGQNRAKDQRTCDIAQQLAGAAVRSLS